MNALKKIFTLLAVVAMLFVSVSTIFAQEVQYTGNNGDGATITITNASKGETYSVVKLFDATVTGTSGGSIAYSGTIPESLSNYFTKNASTGEITATEVAKSGSNLSSEAVTALKTWALTQSATASAVSDGSALSFTNLPYGYYVVISTQGALVTVTSTNPNATIVDKNSNQPNIVKKVKNDSGEWVEVIDANIGEPRQFEIDVTTTNWFKPNETSEQQQIINYVIGDDFSTNKFELISIDSIEVLDKNGDSLPNDAGKITVATGATFPQTITWVDGTSSKYPNGAIIRVIYTAKLKNDALIDVGDTNADLRGNVNTADLNWTYSGDTPHFGEGEDHLTDTAAVDTYAIGLKKFDKNGNSLATAEFEFPFYVKQVDGKYIYAGTSSGTGLTNRITTPEDGQITVQGVKAGTYSILETATPNGYNFVSPNPVSVTATKISSQSTVTSTIKKWKIDSNGNVYDYSEDVEEYNETTYTNNNIAVSVVGIINLKGTELPTTGGIGTTVFHIAGAALAIGAAVLLISKKRMNNN